MTGVAADATVSIPMLDLKAQYAAIGSEIRAAVEGVLQSQHFVLGPNVRALEMEIARYCGTTFAIGVASGTDALMIALAAAGVGPGDEVVTTAFSFIATAGAVSVLGATPVFVDILPDTFNIDPAQIASKVTPKTKAIIPVHLYGQAADMDPILGIARKHGLKVVEDNAQAIGATYRGKKTGSLGDLGCLSFYPSKNLGGYGDGGMILTNSEELADKVRVLASHGARRRYDSEVQGWNSRLDELQAAVLRVKLRYLDEWNAARRQHAGGYDRLLAGHEGIVTPKVAHYGEHVFHQYTIRARNRDGVQQALSREQIASTVYYPVPIHLQEIYKRLEYKKGDLPETEKACQEGLSLPMYAELTEEQMQRVTHALTGEAT